MLRRHAFYTMDLKYTSMALYTKLQIMLMRTSNKRKHTRVQASDLPDQILLRRPIICAALARCCSRGLLSGSKQPPAVKRALLQHDNCCRCCCGGSEVRRKRCTNRCPRRGSKACLGWPAAVAFAGSRGRLHHWHHFLRRLARRLVLVLGPRGCEHEKGPRHAQATCAHMTMTTAPALGLW